MGTLFRDTYIFLNELVLFGMARRADVEEEYWELCQVDGVTDFRPESEVWETEYPAHPTYAHKLQL